MHWTNEKLIKIVVRKLERKETDHSWGLGFGGGIILKVNRNTVKSWYNATLT
jgi:hypothetical protein